MRNKILTIGLILGIVLTGGIFIVKGFSGSAQQVCEAGATCNNYETESFGMLGADGDTNLTNLVLEGDLTVGDDVVIGGDIALSGTISGYLSSGLADQTASTTALESTTLLESQLMLGAFSITNTHDGGADGLFILTLPATSTMTTIIPDDGDCLYGFRIYNDHATAASSTTITAGTGMTIYESENGDEIIAGAGVGVLDFCRRSTTDVDVFISGYTTD